MPPNDPVSVVQKTVEMYTEDPKRLASELYHFTYDEQKAFSNALKAVAFLKETKAYGLLVKAYTTLGQIYLYQDNCQMAMEMDESAWYLVRKHRMRGRVK